MRNRVRPVVFPRRHPLRAALTNRGKDTQGFPLVKDFPRSAALAVFLLDDSLSPPFCLR